MTLVGICFHVLQTLVPFISDTGCDYKQGDRIKSPTEAPVTFLAHSLVLSRKSLRQHLMVLAEKVRDDFWVDIERQQYSVVWASRGVTFPSDISWDHLLQN